MKLLYRYDKKSNVLYSILLYPKLLYIVTDSMYNSMYKIMNDSVLYRDGG